LSDGRTTFKAKKKEKRQLRERRTRLFVTEKELSFSGGAMKVMIPQGFLKKNERAQVRGGVGTKTFFDKI